MQGLRFFQCNFTCSSYSVYIYLLPTTPSIYANGDTMFNSILTYIFLRNLKTSILFPILDLTRKEFLEIYHSTQIDCNFFSLRRCGPPPVDPPTICPKTISAEWKADLHLFSPDASATQTFGVSSNAMRTCVFCKTWTLTKGEKHEA